MVERRRPKGRPDSQYEAGLAAHAHLKLNSSVTKWKLTSSDFYQPQIFS